MDKRNDINQNEIENDIIVDSTQYTLFLNMIKYISINLSLNGKARDLIQLYLHLKLLQSMLCTLMTKMKF